MKYHYFKTLNFRLNFSTPFSTNAVSICRSIGLQQISRIEVSRRYLISFIDAKPSTDIETKIVDCIHDRMTQCRYLQPVQTFTLARKTDKVYDVDVLGEGRIALEKANKELGEILAHLLCRVSLWNCDTTQQERLRIVDFNCVCEFIYMCCHTYNPCKISPYLQVLVFILWMKNKGAVGWLSHGYKSCRWAQRCPWWWILLTMGWLALRQGPCQTDFSAFSFLHNPLFNLLHYVIYI